ncbi:MAG: hypothetical protein AAFO95_01115 [Cyanobacteria bacterium J06600_6]
MSNSREYIYSFPNTSCTLAIIGHLRREHQSHLDSVAVINLIDRWIVKLNLKSLISEQIEKNLKAVLNEMGSISQPSFKILEALNSLEQGQSPTDVMNRYQVVIVVHGKPETEEIEIFRDRIVERLGYCPQNMV